MNYIENVFICLFAPLLIAVHSFSGYRRKMLLFFIGGMTACLLASYISSFLMAILGADMHTATFEITPMVEETMKLFPILFYLLVFEPKKEAVAEGVLMIAVGFATFENVCYLIANGASDVVFLLIRGFGTGAMHVICGAVVAVGLQHLWGRRWVQGVGILGLLSLAITYHAIYNLLIGQGGITMCFTFLLLVLTAVLVHLMGGIDFDK